MCRLVIAVALLAVVFAHEMPTAEQMKEHLIKEGISAEAAAGISAIGEKHKDEFAAAKGDKDAVRKLFDQVKTETDAYIKTQSEADQTAYNAFIEKKKAKIQEHLGGVSA